MNEQLTEKRTPEQIGAEIRMYVDVGRRVTLLCGIEIGRRLVEAKELLPHGEWLPWLQRETEFSERSAQNYMKVFTEYGAAQLGLFGPETNTQTFADLPISKAIALLSVPESERVEFAEVVDAEHISVRELEEKIRERERQVEALQKDMDGERERLRESERLRSETEALLKTQDDMLVEAKKQIAELAKLNDELEHRPVEVAVETVRDEEAIAAAAKEAREEAEKENERAQKGLQKQLASAEKNVKELQRQYQDTLKEMNKLRKQAENSGAAADQKIAEANREAERFRAELEEARKQLKTSDADVTAFGIRYSSIQSDWSYMMTELRKVEARDAGTGEKLREAVRHLLEYFRKELEENVHA